MAESKTQCPKCGAKRLESADSWECVSWLWDGSFQQSHICKLNCQVAALTAQLAQREQEVERLNEALDDIRSDAQATIDGYNKNGPSWTSPGGGEYYSASFVLSRAEEIIADCAPPSPEPGA